MSDYLTPCQRPENNPEDWFIEKDGRQYADDDLVAIEDAEEIASDFHPDDHSGIEGAIAEAEAEAVRENLRRRRHAKDACYTCYFRLQCLTAAMDERPNHGTWGGYFPEELRQILRLKDERERARAEREDVAVGE